MKNVQFIKYDTEIHKPIMEILKDIADQSKSNKRKVGAFIYDSIFNTFYDGYNHIEIDKTPKGISTNIEFDNVTNPFTIHAEEHALNLFNSDMLQQRFQTYDSVAFKRSNSREYMSKIVTDYHTLFTTFSPCFECAKMISNNPLIKTIYVFNVKESTFLEHKITNNEIQYQSILSYLSQNKKVVVIEDCEELNEPIYTR